jgi:hypothetical protein
MEQERNDGGQQCGQQGEQHGGQNIRSSPRLSEKGKAEDLKRLHERRKRLRLPPSHRLALLKIKNTKKSMMKILPLTVKALDMMMELLAMMTPSWLLSAMVIRENSSNNLCDSTLRVL